MQQLYRAHKRTGTSPTLKRPGRPRSPPLIEYENKLMLGAYRQFRMRACYIERLLIYHGIRINHNKIHLLLKDQEMALEEPRKRVIKKRTRDGREHSNELWRVNWHQIKDPSGRDSVEKVD